MNQLFYNVAGGIVHKIRHEKWTTRSEVIVRGKRNIKWSEANRAGADAKSLFPLFFSFSASFKNSSPREKVGKLSSFWDWWAESLFVSIIVAKYIIFPRANNGRSREKKILAKRFAHAISVHYRDFEHAYVYWIWLRGSDSYVITHNGAKLSENWNHPTFKSRHLSFNLQMLPWV